MRAVNNRAWLPKNSSKKWCAEYNNAPKAALASKPHTEAGLPRTDELQTQGYTQTSDRDRIYPRRPTPKSI